MAECVWEQARVFCGLPVPGKELTEDYNALEAGLYRAISLDKGCYVGQETLAKVHGKAGVASSAPAIVSAIVHVH
jgi:tRNA-modifying protein YgfZ